MCGIAGFVDFEGDVSDERALLQGMADRLKNRGPDAEGYYLSPHACLAHRRLIVLDPDGGKQPMRVGKTVLSFNGEIYNFVELRQRLQLLGRVFTTRSDTEVILHSYAQWGEGCVEQLNGIFAFALWDEGRQTLFLARDHLGVKPLFFTRTTYGLIFGSEMKALLAHPAVKPLVDADGLAHILTGLLSVPGMTPFRDIRELPPATTLTVDADGLRTHRYWRLTSRPHLDSLEKTVQTVRALLDDAVRRQLVADRPVVSMLSGGLDSSGITALAARERRASGKTLASHSVDFAEQAAHFTPNMMHLSLDTPWALAVAEHARTEQHTLVVGPDELLDNIMLPTFAHDAPGMGQMEVSLYLLCREMKKHATVALSGEAADEIFGGYPWFVHPEALSAPTFPWLAMFRGVTKNYYSAEVLAHASPRAYVDRRYRQALEDVPRLAGETPDDARRRELFYHNITHFLPLLLHRKDRMSMACGFEVRVPFCDHRLVDYVWNVPWRQKSVGGIEKGLLRQAFADLLPPDVLARKKSPYPAVAHPAYQEGVRRLARAIVHDPNACIRPFMDVAELKKLTDAPSVVGAAGSLNTPFERVIQLEGWLKAYKVEVV